jgi:hypothetical protein
MPWTHLRIAADDLLPERERRQVEDYVDRRARPRFYADENFPSVAIQILRQLGADVLTVHDARLRRHPDENHVAAALRLGRILITCDRDYLNDRRFPLVHCPALIVCDFGSGTVGIIPLGGVTVGIPSVRRWWGQKRSTRGRQRAAGEDEGECAKPKTPPYRRPVD